MKYPCILMLTLFSLVPHQAWPQKLGVQQQAIPLPVQQVEEIGLTQCSSIVEQMSQAGLQGSFQSQSGWHGKDPAKHLFQSVAILQRPDVSPGNGLVAMVASPTNKTGCDGALVQVFPLSGNCETAELKMTENGAVHTPIANIKMMVTSSGDRMFLLPGANDTCVAVSVDSFFGS